MSSSSHNNSQEGGPRWNRPGEHQQRFGGASLPNFTFLQNIKDKALHLFEAAQPINIGHGERPGESTEAQNLMAFILCSLID